MNRAKIAEWRFLPQLRPNATPDSLRTTPGIVSSPTAPLQTEKSTGKRPIPDRKRLSGRDDPVCHLRIPNHGTIGRCLRSTHSGTRLRPSIPPQELRHPICRSLKTEPVTVRSGGPEDYTADGPGVDSPQTDPERIQRHEALPGVSSRSEPGPDEHFLPEAFIQA